VSRRDMGSIRYFHPVLLPVLANSAREEVLARETLFGKPVMPDCVVVSKSTGKDPHG